MARTYNRRKKTKVFLKGDRLKAYNLLIEKCIKTCNFDAHLVAGIFDVSPTKVSKDANAELRRQLDDPAANLRGFKMNTNKLEIVSVLFQEVLKENNISAKLFNDVSVDVDNKEVIVEETVENIKEELKDESIKLVPVEAGDDDGTNYYDTSLYRYITSKVGYKNIKPLDTTHDIDTIVKAELFGHKLPIKDKQIMPYNVGQTTSSLTQIDENINRFMNDNAVISLKSNIRKDVEVYLTPSEYSLEYACLANYCIKNNIHLDVYESVAISSSKYKSDFVLCATPTIPPVRTVYCERIERTKLYNTKLAELLWIGKEDPSNVSDNTRLFRLILKTKQSTSYVLISDDYNAIIDTYTSLLKDRISDKTYDSFTMYLHELAVEKNKADIRIAYSA